MALPARRATSRLPECCCRIGTADRVVAISKLAPIFTDRLHVQRETLQTCEVARLVLALAIAIHAAGLFFDADHALIHVWDSECVHAL